MSFRAYKGTMSAAQEIQRSLLYKWKLAKEGAEAWAQRMFGGSERQAYIRGFNKGYWKGAEDIVTCSPKTEIRSVTH